MPVQVAKSAEPIPGYTLCNRIGAGGYGEVWSAEMVGGLTKAIKFVYGYLDDDRAAREMKALNRIKEVRHPFLLSLERIDVIDGQLIIVTELAEGSLKDRFEECQKNGMDGIPREELLQHMRDAADALDYMSERYSLQHLDVKPENLLLVGGRVKVADFGLVKELHDVTASIMGGLTPLYAPPESFDGRPSLHSDQYSLAIVYQEMLTGAMPFPGTTAAQLATQHLHSKPRISALPPHDRIVVAKALAKRPDDRFGSCREMVEHLCNANVDEASDDNTSAAETRSAGSGVTRRDSISRSSAQISAVLPDAKPTGGSLLPPVDPSPLTVIGEPVELDKKALRLRPTCIVGIGGVAGQVLLGLRRRLRDRLGEVQALPAMQMLLVDTDVKSLINTTQEADDANLDPNETLAMPLRRPQDYRASSKKLTQSLSRRWLYNVPRSLMTEGLRPLGRLAMMDHSSQLAERLKSAIQAAITPEAIEQSQKSCNMEFESQEPHVIVVASIDGGTGSGMTVDMGYLIRSVLRDLEQDHASVSGILLHGTGRNPTTNDLAISNAYTCLCELAHHGRSDRRYPGDPALGIRPFPRGTAPYDASYVVHMGTELNDEQYASSAEQVAEYVYLDAVTSCGGLLNRVRSNSEPAGGSNLPRIRTFSLAHVGISNSAILPSATNALCKRVVQGWLGDPSHWNMFASIPATTTTSGTRTRSRTQTQVNPDAHIVEEMNQTALEHSRQHSLGFDNVCDAVHNQIYQFLGPPLQQTLEQLWADSANYPSQPEFFAKMLQEIDFELGIRDEEGRWRDSPLMAQPREMLAGIDAWVEQSADTMVQWILSLVDESSYHLRGAQQAARWYDQHLIKLREDSQTAEQKINGEIVQLFEELTNPAPPEKNSRRAPVETSTPQQKIEQYQRLRLFRLTLHGVRRVVAALRSRLESTSECLQDLRRIFTEMVQEFEATDVMVRQTTSIDTQLNEVEELSETLSERIHGRITELAQKLDEEFRNDFLDEFGGLRGTLAQDINLYNNIPSALRRTARELILNNQETEDIVEMILPMDEDPEKSIRRLVKIVESATPKLVDCGGSKRLFLVVPPNSKYERLKTVIERGLSESVSVAFNNIGDAVLCYEVEQIPLAQVAGTLIANRRDYAEIAARLHTRNDITWSPW